MKWKKGRAQGLGGRYRSARCAERKGSNRCSLGCTELRPAIKCEGPRYKLLLPVPAPPSPPVSPLLPPAHELPPLAACRSTGSFLLTSSVALMAAWSEGKSVLSCAAGCRPCTSADSTLCVCVRGGGEARRSGAVNGSHGTPPIPVGELLTTHSEEQHATQQACRAVGLGPC